MFDLLSQDADNAPLVQEIIEKVDQFELDDLANLWEELVNYQPFLHRFLFSYEKEVAIEMLIEMQRIVAMIYLHFKERADIKALKVTENDYEEAEARNAAFIKYFSNEDDEGQVNVALSDLMKLKSKSLYFGIVKKFESYPLLKKIDPFKKTTMLLEIKSLIECFERRFL